MCVRTHVYSCHNTCQRSVYRSHVSPSTVWVLEIELKSLDLATSLTHWAIPPALGFKPCMTIFLLRKEETILPMYMPHQKTRQQLHAAYLKRKKISQFKMNTDSMGYVSHPPPPKKQISLWRNHSASHVNSQDWWLFDIWTMNQSMQN